MSSSRKSLIGTSLLTAVAFCSPNISSAAEWTGDVDSDWNTAGNWSGGTVPSGENAEINITPANIATISADLAATPVDVFVGNGAGTDGRLDHTAGAASTGAGNWMVVGNSNGIGTYNLADTGVTGSGLTGFGQGSGSMTTNAAEFNIGFGDNGVGIANVNTSGTVTVGTRFGVGRGAGGNGPANGTLNFEAGTINTGINANDPNGTGEANMFVGGGGATGQLNMSGGTLNVGSQLMVGDGGGSNGTAVMDGGTINTGTVGGAFGNLNIGFGGGTGNMTVNDGTINTGGWNFIGDSGGSEGILTMNGGSLSNASETLIGNNGGSGTLVLSGGSYTNTSGPFSIGAGGGGVGSVTLNDAGARLEGNEIRIGAFDASADGTLNLTSGIAAANQISLGEGTQVVNFDGGTLQARSSNENFMNASSGTAAVNFNGGGAVIDSNGFDITVNQSLGNGGGGGLTKIGGGSLTLGSANTYTGTTTVSDGTLALGAGGAIDNSSELFLNGGNFNVSGIGGGYTLGAGQTLSGNGNVTGNLTVAGNLAIGTSPGTMSFGGLTLTGTMTYELIGGDTGLGSADLADVSGTLSLDGAALDLVQLGTFTLGDKFTLFGYGDFTPGGQFAGLGEGDVFNGGGGQWQISYEDPSAGTNGGTGTGFVTITAVPEPGVLSLVGLAGLALVGRRRRN